MELIVQIKSMAFSFLYGIFFNLCFNVFYNILFTKNKYLNIVTNFVFNLFIFSLYFWGLYSINNGIIHFYFIMILFVGFFIYCKVFVKLRVKFKKV